MAPQPHPPRKRTNRRRRKDEVKITVKGVLWIGTAATGVLALGAVFYKASLAIQIPDRVGRLESSQVEMAKRIDSLSADISTMRMSSEANARRTEDWQQRISTVMSEMSGSIRSLRDSAEIQARENIRTSEQVKNLQVITDELSRKAHQ